MTAGSHFPDNQIKNNKHEDRLKGKRLIIPVFVPHMGCPHDCCFCNQRRISGHTLAPTEEDIKETIYSYKRVAPNYGKVEVAFYGGSFTAIPEEEQEKYLKAAFENLPAGGSIRVSCREGKVQFTASIPEKK